MAATDSSKALEATSRLIGWPWLVACLFTSLCGMVSLLGCSGNSPDPSDAGSSDQPRDRPSAEAPLDGPLPDSRMLLLPAGSTVKGLVVSSVGEDPIAGARVAFGGQLEGVQSDAQGRFSLTIAKPVQLDRVALTAGHESYFSGGVEVLDPSAEQRITIAPLTLTDDPTYEFKGAKAPTDITPFCWHCHQPQVVPFLNSTHAKAARNPKLFDLYNGTISGIGSAAACTAAGGVWRRGQIAGRGGAEDKCYRTTAPSVLADLNPGVCGAAGQAACDDPSAPAAQQPKSAGPCADCHAALSAANAPGTTNLNSVRGLAFTEGLTCDFCHKIDRVIENDKPGVAGAITLRRPATGPAKGWSKPEVMFGPLADVPLSIMGNVYRPQYLESSYCSACHQWRTTGIRPGDAALIDATKWPNGLPIHDTYSEWQGRGQSIPVTWTCQTCHMPAIDVETAAFPLGPYLDTTTGGANGWKRPFGAVRSHAFAARQAPLTAGAKVLPGEPTRALLRKPLEITVDAQRKGTELVVDVSLKNRGAGHSIPTGTPSRQLLLLVTARAQGTALEPSGGATVPEWTGALLAATIASGGTAAGTASLVGETLTLLDGRTFSSSFVGQRARFVAASGPYADYPATGWHGDAARTPAEKGMQLLAPQGGALIKTVNGGIATLDRALVVAAGSRLLIGAPAPATTLLEDQRLATKALAGASGWAFAKVLRDRDGTIGVPFFRAVDIVSDNRIPAAATVKTEHRFDATTISSSIEVIVTLLYRRYPWARARRHGWKVDDIVRQQTRTTVP